MSYPTDHLNRVLFIDVETANEHESYIDLSDDLRYLWQQKMKRSIKGLDQESIEPILEALFYDKGAIYAEFAKVVCISVGYLSFETDHYEFRTKSFVHQDESIVLYGFHHLLSEYYYDRFNQFLCGHNIKEFDVPFICRRMLINGMQLPNLLKIRGYKPWQVHHLLDTMEMWKFGDYKHYTSLELLCHILGIDTPKDDMKGADVNEAYWAGRLDDIATYCQKDVFATAQVYLKCIGSSIDLKQQVIIHAEEE